jgi:hypothetical protein
MYFVIFIDIFSKRFGCTSCGTNQRRLPSSNCGKLKWRTKLGRKLSALGQIMVEYTNDEFRDFCEQYSIKRHFTVRKTSQ